MLREIPFIDAGMGVELGEESLCGIVRVTTSTPAPVTELNAALPRELAKIIRRCLTKDIDRRYQNAKDIRNELEELKQELESGTSKGSSSPPLCRPHEKPVGP